MANLVESIREFMPYVRLYHDRTFVVKIGGGVLENNEKLEELADQIAVLSEFGLKLVIVHGGGNQASEMSRKLGVEPKIVAGRRVTDDTALDIAKQVYGGKLNIELVSTLIKMGVNAVGLSGVDAGLVMAEKRPPVSIRDDNGVETVVDFGHVGDIKSVNPAILDSLLSCGYVPVVSSLGGDGDGSVFNMNADSVATAIATQKKAEKLIFVTTVRGLLRNKDDSSSLIPFVDAADIQALVKNGTISAGMRPKVEACMYAVKNGVSRTHIISGLLPDTLLMEVFSGEGCGTMIVEKREDVAAGGNAVV